MEHLSSCFDFLSEVRNRIVNWECNWGRMYWRFKERKGTAQLSVRAGNWTQAAGSINALLKVHIQTFNMRPVLSSLACLPLSLCVGRKNCWNSVILAGIKVPSGDYKESCKWSENKCLNLWIRKVTAICMSMRTWLRWAGGQGLWRRRFQSTMKLEY